MSVEEGRMRGYNSVHGGGNAPGNSVETDRATGGSRGDDLHRSHWLRQALASEERCDAPLLTSSTATDVAIVGGGFTGLWTAIHLKQREPACDVIVLEKDICGGGASGRNGGFVLSWWPKIATLAKICGREEAVRLAHASEKAIGELGAFCQKHEIDADFRQEGWLWTAGTEAELGAWEPAVEICESFGHPLFERLPADEVAARSGSEQHIAGVLDPTAAIVDPGRLVRGLRRVALDLGVRIYEHTDVRALGRTNPPTLRTLRGTVTASSVVLALHTWASNVRELSRRIFVVGSTIMVTPPIRDRLHEIGRTGGEALTDSLMRVHYSRITDDGRIAFGKGGVNLALAGWTSHRWDRNPAGLTEVMAGFQRLYPNLRDVGPDHDWAGPVDRSLSGLPVFGQLNPRSRIYYGAGYSGNGVGPTLMAGRILSGLALGVSDEWSNCGLVGYDPGALPPEPLRYLAGRVVLAGVRSKERAEINGRRPGRITEAIAGLAPVQFLPKR